MSDVPHDIVGQQFGTNVQPSHPDDPLADERPPRVLEQSAPRSRKRGKAAATIALGQAARDVLAASAYSMTLRQLYYALVSVEAIPKTEASYGKLKR